MSILGSKSKCLHSGLRENLDDKKKGNRQWIMKRSFNFEEGGMLGYGFYIKISWPERSKNQLFCTTVLNKSHCKIWEKKIMIFDIPK